MNYVILITVLQGLCKKIYDNSLVFVDCSYVRKFCNYLDILFSA